MPMTTQTGGYKAQVFESRYLALFFLIAFAWSWLFWWFLYLIETVYTFCDRYICPKLLLKSTQTLGDNKTLPNEQLDMKGFTYE
jgi:hypothetical protein